MLLDLDVAVGQKVYDDVSTGLSKLADSMEKAGDGYSRLLEPHLLKALQLVAKEMRRKHGASWSPGRKGNLQMRSGAGLRSIVDSIAVSLNSGGLEGSISAGSLSVHEKGARIKARSGGFLTIPLPAALDPRGVPLRQRARDWDNTFVARSRKGNLLIFRRLPRAQEIVPLYVLKTSVTIPPRLGMEKAIIGDALPYFERKTFEVLSDMLARM